MSQLEQIQDAFATMPDLAGVRYWPAGEGFDAHWIVWVGRGQIGPFGRAATIQAAYEDAMSKISTRKAA